MSDEVCAGRQSALVAPLAKSELPVYRYATALRVLLGLTVPLAKAIHSGTTAELQRVETFAGAACFREHLGRTSVNTKYHRILYHTPKRLPSSHSASRPDARHEPTAHTCPPPSS